MALYEEKLAALDKLKTEQAEHLKSMKDDKGEWGETTAEQREQLAKRNKDIAAIRGELAELGELKNMEDSALLEDKKAANLPKGAFTKSGLLTEQPKTLGESFVKSDIFQSNLKNKFTGKPTFSFVAPEMRMGGEGMDNIKSADVENTFFAPPNYRIPLVVTSAQRPGIIQTIIPTIATTERNAVPYMLETTFTNNSAAVAQTVALAVSRLDYTQQTQNIQTIGTYIPVTEQMMQDVTGVMGLINMRLSLMQEQTIETELISGSGSGSHLTGYLSASSIQHQALGSDDIYTAIAKGFNLVRFTGYVEPDYLVMNSADMLTVRTKKDALGNFIFGPPNLQANEIIWGLPIVTTNGITSGTALTGAFRMMSARYIAQGVTVEVGRINDNFVTLEWAIRITQREALVVNRGTAFCYIDGLAAA